MQQRAWLLLLLCCRRCRWLLQLPRRCLPLSHGRCQYYGHCENAGAGRRLENETKGEERWEGVNAGTGAEGGVCGGEQEW